MVLQTIEPLSAACLLVDLITYSLEFADWLKACEDAAWVRTAGWQNNKNDPSSELQVGRAARACPTQNTEDWRVRTQSVVRPGYWARAGQPGPGVTGDIIRWQEHCCDHLVIIRMEVSWSPRSSHWTLFWPPLSSPGISTSSLGCGLSVPCLVRLEPCQPIRGRFPDSHPMSTGQGELVSVPGEEMSLEPSSITRRTLNNLWRHYEIIVFYFKIWRFFSENNLTKKFWLENCSILRYRYKEIFLPVPDI